MPTSELSTGESQIPPWIIKGSVSPWKERLHFFFYCRIINKELVKYLLLLRKSSRGSSRLHRHLGWKETERPLGLTYSPYPSCGQRLRTAQLHSQLCTRNCPRGILSFPGCQQRSSPQALLGYGVAPTQGS